MLGLMPHPEHAVDPLTGSTDGLRVFERRCARGARRDASRRAKHRELGLTDSEYELIVEKLGREPNDVELAMFSLLWSEHCAYKHSRKLLRRLPTEGERVVMGPGENAGAVDIGNGYAVAFKVESHNHPSAVEPFQGAATGVGGILRDVFAIGARPIAILDSLRFGELDSERSRYLLDGAVRGIGHYGNSIGVPTVGGEIYFEEPYEHNCLVNAMCVGLAKTDEMVRAAAAGVGNAVVLMGASTGRDGIGGASVLASAELGEGDEAKRPTVQIGDPFEESKLLECCLELLGEGAARLAAGPRRRRAHLLGRRDGLGRRGRDRHRRRPGAAARGRHGALRDHGLRVPGADAGRGRAGEGRRGAARSARSGRPASAEIGDGHRHAARSGSCATARSVGEMPVEALVDGCPLYDLEPGRARGLDLRQPGDARPPAPSAEETLLALLASPSVASKRWAFEQYDSVVGSRTVRRPESADAAVLQIPEAGNAIAVSIDGNGRRVACDPYAGTVEAVLECAQNLACVGAEPLGLTNCLNFGNPEKPAPAWQLDRAVSGLADACEALGVPVVGGNVSLYNEGPDGPIYPTPVVGMVGELPDPARVAGSAFAARGRRDRPGRPLRTVARRLGAGEAARRARRGPARARHRRGRRRLRGGPRRGPRGPARLRPRRQRRRPRLRARRVGDRRRHRLPGRPRSRCASAAAPRGGALRRGRRRLPGQRRARRRWRSSARRPDRRGRRRRRSRSPPATAASPSALADAERAWRSLDPFP